MTLQSKLRPATSEDAIFLAKRLREADQKEIAALSADSPSVALKRGMRLSVPHAWVLCDNNNLPFLMGGVHPLPNRVGLVWMLASDTYEQYSKTVLRETFKMLQTLFYEQHYKVLCNVVHAKNIKAIKWLKRLGFIFVHYNQPIGIHGELFHSFAMPHPPQEDKYV